MSEMKTILKFLMDKHGDDAYTLAEKSGVPQPTTQRYLSGKHGEPRISTVKKWADAYGIREGQLLGFEPLDTLPTEGYTNLVVHSFQKDKEKDLITIKQYRDVGASMGSGIILQDQPGQITSWTVTKEWLSKNIPTNTGADNLLIITGFGNSMKGMYNPGDPLVIDAGVKECTHDGVYFFRVGNEGFVKILQRIPGQGIRVISKNPDYEPWTITHDMDFEVLGKVLRIWESANF
jgi:phage repressor protein C with HTH and peptisase S24 domain